MLKFRFGLIIFLLAINNLGVVAQTTSRLIIPESLHGTIKLNISDIPISQHETLGYNELAVFVKNEVDESNANLIQGQYYQKGNYLVFKPYFPFENGMDYIVRTKGADNVYAYQALQIGRSKKLEAPKVTNIYPSASQLPENLLRFYIYFNVPMKKGQALKHIKLVDAKGNIDNHAFMEFKQELWSSDGKRLTLLFDPGRIKRGVSTNLLSGAALLEGKQYKLNILGTWQAVDGQELTITVTKEIEVVAAYRQPIILNNWKIASPRANVYDTLTLQFDRIMDHALVQSMINIVDMEDKPITGYWEILDKEQSIQFFPEKKWKKGKYRIILDGRLEDVAGNNLQNLLDHDKMEEVPSSNYYLPFHTKIH